MIVAIPNDTAEKYIPKPEELFDNVKYDLKTEEGFWLNLSGTYQFIPYVSPRFLNTPSTEKKKVFFTEKYTEANASLDKARKEKTEIKNFHDLLHEISGLRSNIQLYQKKDAIESFELLEALTVKKEEFSEFLINFHQSNKLEKKIFKGQKPHGNKLILI